MSYDCPVPPPRRARTQVLAVADNKTARLVHGSGAHQCFMVHENEIDDTTIGEALRMRPPKRAPANAPPSVRVCVHACMHACMRRPQPAHAVPACQLACALCAWPGAPAAAAAAAGYKWGSKSWSLHTWQKVLVVRHVHQLGFNVINSDMDVVWFRNPMHYFLV